MHNNRIYIRTEHLRVVKEKKNRRLMALIIEFAQCQSPFFFVVTSGNTRRKMGCFAPVVTIAKQKDEKKQNEEKENRYNITRQTIKLKCEFDTFFFVKKLY
jgi:hypothetical protein